jgi:thymidine phosphorylase
MYTAESVIHAKRDDRALEARDIAAFVRGIADGTVTDAQLGAFTMAVCQRGMNMAEQKALTLAMRDSGEILDWSGLDGPVLDKHSTGGVGDMVSLILAPLVAACGGYVPMISGRGLGHTGGTLDKLESIPGFDVHPEPEQFRTIVRQVGAAIIGQTADLAPADRRMYATRDITSTVESIPLIVSSILSKKLAEGLDALVLDVKTGSGAFMRNPLLARELAGNLSRVANEAGLPCTALLTDMNQPLAWTAGNSLEVLEVIDFLAGRRHPRLSAVTFALGCELLQLGGLATGADEALERIRQALDSGEAAERFMRMIVAQGGPPDLVERRAVHLPPAPVIRPVPAGRAGYVATMDTRLLGYCVMHLGGGRRRVEDTIDARVGLSGLCSVGDRLEADTPLAFVHAADPDGWGRAEHEIRRAIGIVEDSVEPLPCVYERMTGAHRAQ